MQTPITSVDLTIAITNANNSIVQCTINVSAEDLLLPSQYSNHGASVISATYWLNMNLLDHDFIHVTSRLCSLITIEIPKDTKIRILNEAMRLLECCNPAALEYHTRQPISVVSANLKEHILDLGN